MQASVQM